MASERPGELLAGRYRRLRTIGVGGMARVHLAEDERLGRWVAVKRLHAESPEEAVARFGREAKLGASLNHPNLVSVYDIETDGESVLIVMEYVEGETLQQAIGRGALEAQRVTRVVGDVAAGLDHAHGHGVVHRDVKPANILIRHDGVAKLADLGIARAAEGTAITRAGTVMGTAAYMAPEQLGGDAAQPRSDVYALAAVAFEALSGQKARRGTTPVEVAHEVVSGPPPDLTRAWPGVPRAVAQVLARGMARRPGDRHPSAGALASDLERSLRSTDAAETVPLTPHASPVGQSARAANGSTRPPGRRLDRPRSKARGAGVAALLAVVLAIGGVAALAGGGDDDGRSDRDQASSPAQQSAADRRSDEPSAAGDRGEDRTADGERSSAGASGGERVGDGGAESAVPAPTDAEGDPVEPNDRGYALMQEGRYEEAIPLLERAVAQYPEGSQELTYAYALYNLGRSLRLAGRPEEAVPILERRLTIPNQTETVERELEAARSAAG